MSKFRTSIGEHIFAQKYASFEGQTWQQKADAVALKVCGNILPPGDVKSIAEAINDFKFMPAGRYLYYGDKPASFYNNCFVGIAQEDTREEWARIAHAATSVLMTGGGYGCDYSVFRPQGSLLKRTGGMASGPIPLMYMVNEIGRNVMQGGSRRSALYASLNWKHQDAQDFLVCKDWHKMVVCKDTTIWDAKQENFNFPAPLDMTNISLNYDDDWLYSGSALSDEAEHAAHRAVNPVFLKNVYQALSTGEPGFSFNFGDKEKETGRNPCCEVTSFDNNDVCNLGSINMAEVDTLEEFRALVRLGTYFLLCGTITGVVPFEEVQRVRSKNRRLGLGLMGMHEWLLKRGYRYEVNEELHKWLAVYRDESDAAAKYLSNVAGVSTPVACRAIAPTGTIGLLSGTSTGIEPLFAVAYKRRYLTGSKTWKFEYVIDGTAQLLINKYGLDPDDIETASDLALHPRRRIKFQADVQDYVDMAISSTINLPQWGTDYNNPDKVEDFAATLAEFAPRLRGFTCYPDGSRGGQPLTVVPYREAIGKEGLVFEEHDACVSGVCGI